LFLKEGQFFVSQAKAAHLVGTQWGVMNESAIYLTGAATLLLLAVPFLPGLRDIPRLIPTHRRIGREWYRAPTPATAEGPVGTGTAHAVECVGLLASKVPATTSGWWAAPIPKRS